MAEKTIALYIDSGSIRLTAGSGRRITEWAYLPLGTPEASESTAVDEKALADKIRELLKANKIRGGKVHIGLSGRHCISRSIFLPRLPGDMMDEAVKREARRVLPVPLEEMYLSWQEVPGAGERSQVFMVAIPKATVDSVLNAVLREGLKPAFLGIKPLITAMSANQDNAVIVDVQTTEFDIVIMAGGVPQTVRTVAFADAGLSTEEKIRTIMNELTRTISFYNSNNNENPLTGSVPVFASGELETGMDFYRNFPAFEDYAVVPLQLTMEYPDSFDPAPYLPCLGMISQRLDGGGGRLSHIAQNSLPLRYQPQPVSMVRVLSIPGAVFAVVMLAFLIMTVLSVTGKIDSLNDMTENTRKTLEEKLAWSSEVSGEISALKKEIAAAETAGDNYGLVFDYMQNQRTRIDGDLTEIIKELPSTIILGQIQHNSTTMQVDGVAAGEKDVLQYITRLEDSRLFGGIVITDMSMNEGGSQNFSLLLDTSEMQSDISVIDVILRYFPADVSLTGLQQQGDTTIIRANAPDEESIVVFLEELESSALFEQISLDSQTDAADGTIDFVFTVKGMY